MEIKQPRRMEPIQQNHPPRGKQEHNHEVYVQTSRKKTKENNPRHNRNKKDKNWQPPKELTIKKSKRHGKSWRKRKEEQIPNSMQICQWKTEIRNKKRIYRKPTEAENPNRRGWNTKYRRKTRQPTKESKNQTHHNMGSEEKSQRMQRTRIYNIHRGGRTNQRPSENKITHSQLLWRPLPSPRRQRKI